MHYQYRTCIPTSYPTKAATKEEKEKSRSSLGASCAYEGTMLSLLVLQSTWLLNDRQVLLAFRNDEKLNKVLFGITITQSGVWSNIQATLMSEFTKDMNCFPLDRRPTQ